jgi:hypothetical protein
MDRLYLTLKVWDFYQGDVYLHSFLPNKCTAILDLIPDTHSVESISCLYHDKQISIKLFMGSGGVELAIIIHLGHQVTLPVGRDRHLENAESFGSEIYLICIKLPKICKFGKIQTQKS